MKHCNSKSQRNMLIVNNDIVATYDILSQCTMKYPSFMKSIIEISCLHQVSTKLQVYSSDRKVSA